MEPRVSAILLAAGESRRMGTCKQLLQLVGRPVIVHCLEAIMASGVNEVIVVTGANGDAVAATVGHLSVKVVRNHFIDSGMADSVRVGLESVADSCSGVMICLADQPLIDIESYRQLLLQHAETPKKILIPVFEGQKGHPAIFPYELLHPFPEDMTLRDVVWKNPRQVRLIEVYDQGVALDMDTPSDYQIMQERFAALIGDNGNKAKT